MKKYSILLAIVLMSGWATLQAQTADEILNNYFENTGGVDAWRAVEGMRPVNRCKYNQLSYMLLTV